MRNSSRRKLTLITILKLLGVKSISEFKYNMSDKKIKYNLRVKSFAFRLRVQHIIYFISTCKLDKDLNYSYPVYLSGPYSRDLSKDYFSISEKEFNNAKSITLNSKLKNFIEYLNQKDNLWLEIASTLKSFIDYNGYRGNKTIERVMELKHDILKANNKGYDYVKKIFEEIKNEVENMCGANDKKKSKCVSVVLTPKEYKLVSKQAEDMGTSISELFHTAWVNYYGMKTKKEKEPKAKNKKRKFSSEDIMYIMELAFREFLKEKMKNIKNYE